MTTTSICGGEDLLGEERGGGREGEHRRPPDVISDERRDYLLLYRAAFLRPWMIGRFRRLCDERLLGLLITKRRLLQAKHRVSMDRLLAFCCQYGYGLSVLALLISAAVSAETTEGNVRLRDAIS